MVKLNLHTSKVIIAKLTNPYCYSCRAAGEKNRKENAELELSLTNCNLQLLKEQLAQLNTSEDEMMPIGNIKGADRSLLATG